MCETGPEFKCKCVCKRGVEKKEKLERSREEEGGMSK